MLCRYFQGERKLNLFKNKYLCVFLAFGGQCDADHSLFGLEGIGYQYKQGERDLLSSERENND